MIASLVIIGRETLEASLLIGIILAYLSHTGNRRHFRTVWFGVGLATLVSALMAAAVILTMGKLTGAREEIFEGGVMLLAAGVLAYVVLWMGKQMRQLRSSLQAQVQAALNKRSALALASLAFLVIFREGAEAALYLSAIASSGKGMDNFIGAGVGLGGAVVAGSMVYQGSRFLNIGTFFKITTIVLIAFAAGMVGQAAHAFQAAGVLPGTITLWDTSAIVPDDSTRGTILRTLIGYTSQPSLLQIMFYLGFIALMISLYVDLGSKPKAMHDEPFSPIGAGYQGALYRLIRKPSLTVIVPAVMGVLLVGLLVIAVGKVNAGPFDNAGPLRLAGFRGPENENNLFNFLMWIIWLPLLSIGTVLLGRIWCGNLCPLRLATDFARDLADKITGKGSSTSPYIRLGWLLPTTFILITFFVKLWPVQTVAGYGAMLFLVILALAVVIGFLFRRGTWCRYICPVGGWLARITRLSPLGLRPNPSACAACVDKPCTTGTALASRCPVYLNPSRLESNRYCTKCWKCVVNCPPQKASLRLGWRFPGAELLKPYSPDLWESLYVASLMGMYISVGHRSLTLANLPFPALFFGTIAVATVAYLALCRLVAPLAGISYRQALTTLGYVFLPLEFAAAVIAFGDDALEFFNIVTPAASFFLTIGFVWSVVLGVSILRHQTPDRNRALVAAVPVMVALVGVLLLWVRWYATGTVIDLT